MRLCGTCTACCTCIGVKALDKPAGVPCKHLTEHGCGIYETRPQECRQYFCLWADPKAEQLNLPEWGRPDQTGLILNAANHDLNAPDASINVYQIPGSSDYWGQKLLKQKRLRAFPMRLVK